MQLTEDALVAVSQMSHGDARALRVEPVRETQLQKRPAVRNTAREKNLPGVLKATRDQHNASVGCSPVGEQKE